MLRPCSDVHEDGIANFEESVFRIPRPSDGRERLPTDPHLDLFLDRPVRTANSWRTLIITNVTFGDP